MKLPGVSGVYDYAGPSRNSRYRSRPCCLPPMQKRRRPDCIFSELNTQPTCTPVYASPHTSRCATQNSGPSGSLLLSRRTLSFPASCRFIPAHCIGDLASTETAAAKSEGRSRSKLARSRQDSGGQRIVSQIPVFRQVRSITKTSTGLLVGSGFRPSCSFIAVNNPAGASLTHPPRIQSSPPSESTQSNCGLPQRPSLPLR